MEEISQNDSRRWTLVDKLIGIVSKSAGPLQVLVAGGLAVALHYNTDPQTMGKLPVYLVRGLAYTACTGLVIRGVENIILYNKIHK